MHHTLMHAHIPNPRFMVMAEMSTFGIFCGRNVQAEMSVAEMSEHWESTIGFNELIFFRHQLVQ